jgi:Domain of unknown function (DUF3303)
MRRLFLTTYRYKDNLGEQDLRNLTKKFQEVGTNPGVIAHYERLDGRGGFLIEELQEDEERNYEVTISYGPWIQFEVFPVTTMEDAFPVIQRVYG